jgi:hypothetical protein
MKKLLLIIAIASCAFGYTVNTHTDTLRADSIVITKTARITHFKADSSTISDSAKRYDNRYLGLHGTSDSSVKCHIADTALHSNDTVRACYKSDTSKVSAYATKADSSRASHISDTALHSKDTVRASNKADTVLKYINLYLGIHGTADSSAKCHISDTVLHPILTTVKQGSGITVTSSADTYFVALYTPPVIASLTNTVNVGYAGQTITSATINWTLTGANITNQTLTDCTPALGDRTHTFTGLTITTDKYWTLAITDGVTPTSASTYIYFYVEKWYGTSTSGTPAASDIQTRNTHPWTYIYTPYRAQSSIPITGGGNYCFYAYPAAWGAVALYTNGFLTVWNLTTVSLTNSYGDTRTYNVYTSPTPITGTFTFTAVAN